MSQKSTLSHFQGSFDVSKSGEGSLVLQAGRRSRWLEIQYLEGAEPLDVEVDKGHRIRLNAGSVIDLHVSEPTHGVTLRHVGQAKGSWGWRREAGQQESSAEEAS